MWLPAAAAASYRHGRGHERAVLPRPRRVEEALSADEGRAILADWRGFSVCYEGAHKPSLVSLERGTGASLAQRRDE